MDRRGAGVGNIAVVNRILVPKPPHAVLGQPVTGGVVAVGSGAHGSLSHRIYQKLARDSGTVAVASHERYGRRQVPSVAVPANVCSGRITVDGGGISHRPLGGGVAVFGRPWKLYLRRQVVVYGNHHAVRPNAPML